MKEMMQEEIENSANGIKEIIVKEIRNKKLNPLIS